MYIFISHSSTDAKTAEDLCDVLEKNGNQCFLAPRDIRSGHEYAEEIINGIDRSDAMLLILSKEANNSPHVLREIERAVSKGLPIIVYKLEEVELTKSMEYFLMTHQWMNAKTSSYDEVLQCVAGIKAKVASKEASEQASENKSQEVPEKAGSSGKNKGLIIGIVAALAVVLMAVIIVLATGGSDANDGSEEKNTGNVADSNTAVKDVELGDTVVFGEYNGEPISWRVIKISDDGKEAVLLSKDIITMKAYDAADSSRFNEDGNVDYWKQESEANTDMELQAKVRGNSDWENSNIRAWLNSAEETVDYNGHPPMAEKMSELKNGYNTEIGFLCNFSEEERQAIVETEIQTKGNALAEGETITTKDKVFLLSMDELEWLKEAGVSLLTTPTDAALEQDKSEWYEVEYSAYNVETYYWWLREPVEGTSSKCYLVGNGYYEQEVYERTVGLEGYGIRPAVTVDLSSDAIKIEE